MGHQISNIQISVRFDVTGTDIQHAAELLTNGEVVAIPTETVYGLAGNALDPMAVAKIFAAKNRPFFDPLIVHTDSIEKIQAWVEEIPETARHMAQQFWPGPLTLVLKKKPIIPDIVTAGNPTVAVRIPNHPLTLQLLSRLAFPLAAPSANPFGYVSPTTAAHVNDQLGDKIPYILDGDACKVGIESTIVSFAGAEPVLLRWGGAAIEQVEAITGPLKIQVHQHSNPQAPGQTDSHYAPKARFVLGPVTEEMVEKYPPATTGIITLSKVIKGVPADNQVQLSVSENLEEAASNIFAAIRILDKKKLTTILAEPMPEIGLGRAINDRLRRAAYKE